MIVNKSMFPLQTGFSVISKMQDRFADLQMQLGTGQKASTLADMGRDLPMSLSVRSRLSAIEGYKANIDTVNLRLSFLDKTMSRLDKMEGEARTSAIQGQYGTNDINMATLPDLSKARLDELVTLLNSDVAGRHLFAGAKTDSAPLPDTEVLLNGQAGKAGFKTVVTERKIADAGSDGMGRLRSTQDAGANVVTLAEDGAHPFGFKLSTVSTSGRGFATAQQAGDATTGDSLAITLTNPMDAGASITIGLTLPDGTETQVSLKAVTGTADPAKGEFAVDAADPSVTAANLKTALDASLIKTGETELAAASTFAAAQNFFNGAGEPVLRVDGADLANATSLRIGTAADTVQWYSGQSPAISATGLGRLDLARTDAVVSLSERAPVSAAHGFQIVGASVAPGAVGGTAGAAVTYAGGDPASASIDLAAAKAGDTISIKLKQPDNSEKTVTLTAVSGRAGPGQFSIDADPDNTAANFNTALQSAVTEVATVAEGNPRQSVTGQVDESTRVSYGMEANESGLLRMMRTFASMSVETYPSADETAKGRFDAMAVRQSAELSEGHNGERGSVEILTMELAVARGTMDNASKRHTDYKAQLDNLLSDVETVSKEDVAMEILALQTRLQASYQVTAMVSQLSLVNFM